MAAAINASGAPPLISVLIPTLNRPGYLAQTVQSALGQTYQNIEIVLSDNASTDDTPALIASFRDPRIRAFRQERQLGMTEHWNACLEKASGSLCILLSDDDVLLPEALSRLAAPIVQEDCELSYSSFVTIDEGGRRIGESAAGPARESGHHFIRAHLSGQRIAMPSGLLFRLDHLRALGGFPNIGTTSDFAVRLALATRGTVACLQSPLVSYRIHSANLSKKRVDVVSSHLQLLNWATDNPSMAPYREMVRRCAYRAGLANGIHCGLVDDINGSEGCREAVRKLRLGRVRDLWVRLVLLSARTAPARLAYRVWRKLKNL